MRGLTEQDRVGPQWLIIGRRSDGSRVVLAERHRLLRAMSLCDHFARHLDGYADITVERIGEADGNEDGRP